MADKKAQKKEIDFSETFQEFFVDTGAIPGSEKHQEFLDFTPSKKDTPAKLYKPAQGDSDSGVK